MDEMIVHAEIREDRWSGANLDAVAGQILARIKDTVGINHPHRAARARRHRAHRRRQGQAHHRPPAEGLRNGLGAESASAFHGSTEALYLFVLTHFLHANRSPLRSEML